MKKLSTLFLMLVLSLALMFSLTACNVSDFQANEDNNFTIKLISSEVTTTSDGYLSQRLTATVTPNSSYNQAVNWSVSWKNPNSSWAINKAVKDYIEVILDSEGALTATVICKQAFSEQVIVTVSSQQDSSKYATCVCDYAKRFLGFDNVKFGVSEAVDNSFKLVKSYSQDTTITSTPIFSDYTYDVSFSSSEFSARLYLYQDFCDKLSGANVSLDFTQSVVGAGFAYEDINSIHKNEDNVVYVKSFNLFYSGNFLYGLMDITDRISFGFGNHTELNNLFNELGTNYDIGFVRFSFNGYYADGGYIDYPIYLDDSLVTVPVQTVTVSNDNIVF